MAVGDKFPIDTKYLLVWDIGPSPSGKTQRFEVTSESSGACLGVIKWFGAWRQYCFYPSEETIWNQDCLTAVTGVLDKLNQRKET